MADDPASRKLKAHFFASVTMQQPPPQYEAAARLCAVRDRGRLVARRVAWSVIPLWWTPRTRWVSRTAILGYCEPPYPSVLAALVKVLEMQNESGRRS